MMRMGLATLLFLADQMVAGVATMADIRLHTYRPGACPSLRVAERPGSLLQGLDEDVSPPAHSAGRPAFFAKTVLGTVAVDLKGNVTSTAQKRCHRFLVEAGMLHRGCVQLAGFGAVDPSRQMRTLAFAADFESVPGADFPGLQQHVGASHQSRAHSRQRLRPTPSSPRC